MCGRQWHQLENSYQKLLCWCLCYSHPAIVRRRTKGLNNIEHLKIAIHQLSSTFYESIPVSGCRNDPLHSGFVVGCFYEWLPGTRIRLPMLLTALRLLCCGEVLCLAGWAGWTCLLRAGWDLLVSLPSLGMWHKRQLRWPCVQVSVCIPHAWWGWGWGLAVDRAGAPPSDLGTACVDLILAAPVGGTFG